MLAPSLMHFLVHSAAPSLAPFTPHLESLIQPLTVVASPANEAVANSETNATAASTNRNFRMPSSFETFLRRNFDARGFQNSITIRAATALGDRTMTYFSFFARPVGGFAGGAGAT